MESKWEAAQEVSNWERPGAMVRKTPLWPWKPAWTLLPDRMRLAMRMWGLFIYLIMMFLKTFLAGERLPFLELKVPTQGRPLISKLINPEPTLFCGPLNTVLSHSVVSDLSLCNLMDYSPPGFSTHGILQARILEWVAVPSSRGSSRPRDGTCVSYVSCIGSQVLYHCTTWKAPRRQYVSASITPEPGNWQLGTTPKARILLNIFKQASP